MSTDYFSLLAPRVRPHLLAYKDDFEVCDRSGLEGFAGEFVLGVRETGTNLLKFTDEQGFAIKDRYPVSPVLGEVTTSEVIEVFVFKANERFFHGKDGSVREVSKEEAYHLYQKAADSGQRFAA